MSTQKLDKEELKRLPEGSTLTLRDGTQIQAEHSVIYSETGVKKTDRVKELESLLGSALCIAERDGAYTAWLLFANRLRAVGISGVTPRPFKIPSEGEHFPDLNPPEGST